VSKPAEFKNLRKLATAGPVWVESGIPGERYPEEIGRMRNSYRTFPRRAVDLLPFITGAGNTKAWE